MVLKLSELYVVAFTKFAAREWKDYCDFLDICHSVTRWLSFYPSLPRTLQMSPALHSYFMSIDMWTVVLKWFFSNSIG